MPGGRRDVGGEVPWTGLVGPLVLCALLSGCEVGKGVGHASGRLRFTQCTVEDGKPLDIDSEFNLNPSFFVGEPFDDNADLFIANSLAVRIQSSTKRIEFADGLLFSFEDTYEVARCMRGAAVDGAPDPRLCDRSTGEGRVLLGTESELAHAFLILNQTCPDSFITANALGACTEGTCPPVPVVCPGQGSWIRFSDFGSVPSEPTEKLDRRFKVNFNERIRATSFHLELCDSGTVDAQRDRELPVKPPRVAATLDGDFDFDLKRGQAAQLFP